MESFGTGYSRARKDHGLHGRKFVKMRAENGLSGHSDMFQMGYRAYARKHCPVRRNIDF